MTGLGCWKQATFAFSCAYFLLTFSTFWSLQRRFYGTPIPSSSKLPRDTCREVPAGYFRGWNQGYVTEVRPAVAVNCTRIFSGDEEELQKANESMAYWKNAVSDDSMRKLVKDCVWLRDYFSNNLYNSKLEWSFPLAFTLVVYNSPQQVLRLLRLMYRPQNAYCIHYDVKSEHRDFFRSIAKCFDNIIVPSKLEEVVWGHYSILGAQMNCMRDLLDYRERQAVDSKWRYLINLCGKELPLVTMRELVVRLARLNGTSSIASRRSQSEEELSRIKHPVSYNNVTFKYVISYSKRLRPPPFDVDTQYYKSLAYIMASHSFADYLVNNHIAIRVHKFFEKCKNPEEHFYATMYHWPGAPGGYDPAYTGSYPEVEGVFWAYDRVCRGKVVHNVCIACAADLQEIVEETRIGKYAFHNKYFMEYDNVVMRCMEERIVQRNMAEYEIECL